MREGPKAVLDNVELTELHRVFEDVCAELEIGLDQSRRDEVATVVMDIAQRGERDYRAIRQRAIIALTNR
jgi:hypothetical protein